MTIAAGISDGKLITASELAATESSRNGQDGALLDLAPALTSSARTLDRIEALIAKSVVPTLRLINAAAQRQGVFQSIATVNRKPDRPGTAPGQVKEKSSKSNIVKPVAGNVTEKNTELSKGKAKKEKSVPASVVSVENVERPAGNKTSIDPSSINREAGQKAALPAPDKKEKSVPAVKPDTGSAMATERLREKREERSKNKDLVSSLKETVSGGWNGEFFFNSAKSEDSTDLAGTAIGGPLWSAARELSEVAGNIGEPAEDDNSLLGLLRKSIEDRTGITSIREKAGKAKERAVENVKSWTAGKRVAKDTLPEGYKRDRSGKVRNEKGHFVSGPQRAMLNAVVEGGEAQQELTADVTDKLTENDKAAGKRHKKLVDVAGMAAGKGEGGILGGILGGAGGILGGGGGIGNGGGGIGGWAGRGKRGSRKGLGKFGKIAGGLMGFAGGAMGLGSVLPMFAGRSDNETGPVKEAASEVAAEKAASTTSKKLTGKTGGKLGGKMAARGAGQALRALGPIASVAMAGYDAYSGWNDKDLQQKAFGLEQGQKATTGQKAASSAANILDMGGLVSGGLSMLGVEASTEGIASGIYSLLGGKSSKEKETLKSSAAGLPVNNEKGTTATSSNPLVNNITPGATASMRKATGSAVSGKPNAETSLMGREVVKLAAQMKELTAVIKANAPHQVIGIGTNKGQQATGGSTGGNPSPPQIPVGFDDTALTLLAHDRL